MLKGISFQPMIGETIKKIDFGHPEKPQHGSYGCYTIEMESGKKIVISSSYLHGEISFWEEKQN